MPILESLASLCAGLFSGAALYINLVEHPARMECGTAVAVAEFGPSYHRATVMQALLAVTGALTAIFAWLEGGGAECLLGGALLGSVVPFTLVVVFPTNKRLLDPSLDPNSAEARALLSRWARLHAVRSALGLAAFIVLTQCLGPIEEDTRWTRAIFEKGTARYIIDVDSTMPFENR